MDEHDGREPDKGKVKSGPGATGHRHAPTNGECIRTLLVDDRPAFLDLAARFFDAHPEVKIVGRATSGREALTQVKHLHPDLVLMDIAMPGMNGFEATSRIKAQDNPPRIIILTLHDLPAYRLMSKTVGADGFVTKTEFGMPLLRLIEELFNGHHNQN